MKVYNFSDYSSVYNKFLSELRDVNIQKDSMRFRKNLERIGEHCTNVAEVVHFMIHSETIRHEKH